MEGGVSMDGQSISLILCMMSHRNHSCPVIDVMVTLTHPWPCHRYIVLASVLGSFIKTGREPGKLEQG